MFQKNDPLNNLCRVAPTKNRSLYCLLCPVHKKSKGFENTIFKRLFKYSKNQNLKKSVIK